jgi:hypothetical protein
MPSPPAATTAARSPVLTHTATAAPDHGTVAHDQPNVRTPSARARITAPADAVRILRPSAPEDTAAPVDVAAGDRPTRRAPAATPPAASPPSVHVTIGRVEVRASTPAQPARSRPQPPRIMSLDEYLTQRAGAHR